MGFLYTASQDAQLFDAPNRVFFQLTPATDVPIAIHWIEIGNWSALGDQLEDVISVDISKGGSGGVGSAITGVSVHDRAPAATATVTGRAANPSGTSAVCLCKWNVRDAGPVHVAVPTDRVKINVANGPITILGLLFGARSFLYGATVCWEEL